MCDGAVAEVVQEVGGAAVLLEVGTTPPAEGGAGQVGVVTGDLEGQEQQTA